jgi:hypothetical protein
LPPGVCPAPAIWAPGIQACDYGRFVHRIEALSCPLPERNPPGSPGSVDDAECDRDDDCAGDEYCIRFSDIDGGTYHRCVKPCVEDSDCGVGRLCACEPRRRSVGSEPVPLGTCRSATCTSDADCGPNSFCRAPVDLESCQVPLDTWFRFACQTPADECSGANECPQPGGERHAVCQPGEPGEAWICSGRDEC